MKKLCFIMVLVLLALPSIAASECEPLRESGDADEKVDLLLVGGDDYENDTSLKEDFNYYIDTENRGLFDVYPMNVTVDRFNVWYVIGRNNSATTSGDRGPFREARYWLDQCETDYAVFMSKTNHDWAGGAYDDVARVDGVGEKVDRDNGAIGLIHEWGHLFGNVADEYNYESGKRQSTRPNCAYNRSQAEKWWSDMAELTDRVGYEKGCKGSKNIEAHPGPTIMGDGGLWSYGPVNERNFLKRITKETEPVTDVSIDSHKVSDDKIGLDITWDKASHVVNVKLDGQTVEQIFAYGTGGRNIEIEKPDSDGFKIELETEKEIEEVSEENNVVEIASAPEIKLESPDNKQKVELKPALSVKYSDPNEDPGEVVVKTGDEEVMGECEVDNGETCEVKYSDADSYDTEYEWYATATDSAGKEAMTEDFKFRTVSPEITALNPLGQTINDSSVELEVLVDENASGEVGFFDDEELVGKKEIDDEIISYELKGLEEGEHIWRAELTNHPEVETDKKTFEVELNSKPEKPAELKPESRSTVEPEPKLSAEFLDQDDKEGQLVFYRQNGTKINSCTARNGSRCSVLFKSADNRGKFYSWKVEARDGESKSEMTRKVSLMVASQKTDSTSKQSQRQEDASTADNRRAEVSASEEDSLPVKLIAIIASLAIFFVLATSIKFE